MLRTVLMDSDKRSAEVERLEVVETGRRRRWSEDEKLKIVLESSQAPRQPHLCSQNRTAEVARRENASKSRGSGRSEEHTSELQSLMRNSYADFRLRKTNKNKT